MQAQHMICRGVYIQYKDNYKPKYIHKVLYKTNAPISLTYPFFRRFQKFGIEAYSYADLFPEIRAYTGEEIARKIDSMKFESFVVINFSTEQLNSAIFAEYSIKGITVGSMQGEMRLYGTVCFYDMQSDKYPFAKIDASIKGHHGMEKLGNNLLDKALVGLEKYHLMINNHHHRNQGR
jgi:hypothetical protein